MYSSNKDRPPRRSGPSVRGEIDRVHPYIDWGSTLILNWMMRSAPSSNQSRKREMVCLPTVRCTGLPITYWSAIGQPWKSRRGG